MEELKNNELNIINEENIKDLIYKIRGQKVMLDFDLARIYGYETKNFNRQIKNNINKFPEDFMFQISKEESEQTLWSQIVTLNKSGNKTGIHIKYLPCEFTGQGIHIHVSVFKGVPTAK